MDLLQKYFSYFGFYLIVIWWEDVLCITSFLSLLKFVLRLKILQSFLVNIPYILEKYVFCHWMNCSINVSCADWKKLNVCKNRSWAEETEGISYWMSLSSNISARLSLLHSSTALCVFTNSVRKPAEGPGLFTSWLVLQSAGWDDRKADYLSWNLSYHPDGRENIGEDGDFVVIWLRALFLQPDLTLAYHRGYLPVLIGFQEETHLLISKAILISFYF